MITKPEIISSTTPDTPATIYEFLKDSPVGVVATVTPKGEPHAAVVYFSINKDFQFTFVTKKRTQKSLDIEDNNQVVLVVFDAFSQTTVQVFARAEEIKGNNDAEQAFNHTLDAAQQTSDTEIPPISRLNAGDYIAYLLMPTRIEISVFVRPDPSGIDMHEYIEFKA